jgi:hypothetical protein
MTNTDLIIANRTKEYAMMRSVLVIFLVFCVVFCCLACYDEVSVGHLLRQKNTTQQTKKMTNTDLIIASKTTEYNTEN